MLPHDGGADTSDRPVIAVVNYGNVEQGLIESLARSVEGYLLTLDEEVTIKPAVLRSRKSLPEKIPELYQGTFLLSHLHNLPGNIVIGITDIIFFDPHLPRRIFGYGSGGRGVISTYRFRRESDNRHALYDRLNKEVIKIFAMACDLPVCNDTECIVMYHKSMEDIDKNTRVCQTCHQKIVKSLEYYMGAKSRG